METNSQSTSSNTIDFDYSNFNNQMLTEQSISNSNAELIDLLSKLKSETQIFMIKILKSKSNLNTALLSKIKNELLNLVTKMIVKFDLLQFTHQILDISRKFELDSMPTIKLFFNNRISNAVENIHLNSLQYTLTMCLLHLVYLEKEGLEKEDSLSHKLRIDMANLFFRRFTIKVFRKNEIKYQKNQDDVDIKKYVQMLCGFMRSAFNLKKNIIVFAQKNNNNQFLIQTTEQYDISTINYMRHIMRSKREEIEAQNWLFNYKVSDVSWYLPMSFNITPRWFFSNTMSDECEDFANHSQNYKIMDKTILSIQSMFACSVIDILNVKNCITMINIKTANLSKTKEHDEFIQTSEEQNFFIYTLEKDMFVPNPPKIKLNIFFREYTNYKSVKFGGKKDKEGKFKIEEEGNFINLRDLVKFFISSSEMSFGFYDIYFNFCHNEFYDIYFNTHIHYKCDLLQMFNIRDIEAECEASKLAKVKDGGISKCNEENTLNIECTDIFKKIKEKTWPIFSEEQESLYQILMDMCSETRWEIISESLLRHLKNDGVGNNVSISFIIVMYYYYCSQHNLEPKIKFSTFMKACGDINQIHTFFPKSEFINLMKTFFEKRGIRINVDESLDYSNEKYYECEMLKHILKMLLENGYITSVIALIMRLDVVLDHGKLRGLIVYCMDLIKDSMTDYEKYIFLSLTAIADQNEDFSNSIKSCFFPNIILYFLCDFNPDTEFIARVKYFIGFLNGEFRKFFFKNSLNDLTFVKLVFDGESSLSNENNTRNEPPIPNNDSTVVHESKKQKISDGPKEEKKTKIKKLSDIFSKVPDTVQTIIKLYIGFMFKRSGITYVYDRCFYRDIKDIISGGRAHVFGYEHQIFEPSHCSFWYRRKPGIYNSYTRAFERHSPGFFGVISLESPSWVPDNYDYNSFDYELKNKLLDTTLKAVHFLKICSYNKIMTILLGPIEDPTKEGPLVDFYPIKSAHILLSDLNSTNDFLPNDFYNMINRNHPKLNKVILWFYLIICELSLTVPNMEYLILHPRNFLNQLFMGIQNDDDSTGIILDTHITQNVGENQDTSYSMYDQMWTGFDITTTLDNVSKNNEAVSFENEEFLSTTHITHHRKNKKASDVDVFNRVLHKNINEEMFYQLDLWNEIEINGGDELKIFLIKIISWFVRMGEHHPFRQTPIFNFIVENRCELYQAIKSTATKICGPLLKNSGRDDMAIMFKMFCQNTYLTLYDDFNEPMPPGYELNHVVQTKYDMHIYRSVSDLLFQAQFNDEVLVDLLKTFTRFQHHGNTERLCTAFINKTASGKSELMKMLCGQLCTTHYSTQYYTGQDLRRKNSKYRNNLAHTLNKNLLTCFDECQILGKEIFCGSGKLPSLKLYIDVNSHLIFATNLDLKISDAAVLSRLNIFERRFQFVQCSQRVVADRTKHDNDIDEISNDLGVQILLERLPRGRVECGFGYYLMMFLMSDIFLYTFSQPVSSKISKTLKRTKDIRIG